jgi:hypothetical protein
VDTAVVDEARIGAAMSLGKVLSRREPPARRGRLVRVRGRVFPHPLELAIGFVGQIEPARAGRKAEVKKEVVRVLPEGVAQVRRRRGRLSAPVFRGQLGARNAIWNHG